MAIFFKRKLILILAFFVLGISMPPASALSEFLQYAQSLSQNGVINTQSSEYGYRLSSTLSRAEGVKMTMVSAGVGQKDCRTLFSFSFADVNASLGTLCGYIEGAVENQIISSNNTQGNSTTTTFNPNNSRFLPNTPITRGDFADIIVHSFDVGSPSTIGALGDTGNGSTQASSQNNASSTSSQSSQDSRSSQSYYTDVPSTLRTSTSINRLATTGCINTTLTSFRPYASITRGEAFKIMSCLVGKKNGGSTNTGNNGGIISTNPIGTDCYSLYWKDATNTSCQSQKQFCGTYMYQGLQTFSTQAACLGNTSNTSTSSNSNLATSNPSSSSSSYAWSTTSYGVCSKTCGGGVQSRTVSCKKTTDNSVVADSFCIATGVSKPVSQKLCGVGACTTSGVSNNTSTNTSNTNNNTGVIPVSTTSNGEKVLDSTMYWPVSAKVVNDHGFGHYPMEDYVSLKDSGGWWRCLSGGYGNGNCAGLRKNMIWSAKITIDPDHTMGSWWMNVGSSIRGTMILSHNPFSTINVAGEDCFTDTNCTRYRVQMMNGNADLTVNNLYFYNPENINNTFDISNPSLRMKDYTPSGTYYINIFFRPEDVATRPDLAFDGNGGVFQIGQNYLESTAKRGGKNIPFPAKVDGNNNVIGATGAIYTPFVGVASQSTNTATQSDSTTTRNLAVEAININATARYFIEGGSFYEWYPLEPTYFGPNSPVVAPNGGVGSMRFIPDSRLFSQHYFDFKVTDQSGYPVAFDWTISETKGSMTTPIDGQSTCSKTSVYPGNGFPVYFIQKGYDATISNTLKTKSCYIDFDKAYYFNFKPSDSAQTHPADLQFNIGDSRSTVSIEGRNAYYADVNARYKKSTGKAMTSCPASVIASGDCLPGSDVSPNGTTSSTTSSTTSLNTSGTSFGACSGTATVQYSYKIAGSTMCYLANFYCSNGQLKWGVQFSSALSAPPAGTVLYTTTNCTAGTTSTNTTTNSTTTYELGTIDYNGCTSSQYTCPSAYPTRLRCEDRPGGDVIICSK